MTCNIKFLCDFPFFNAFLPVVIIIYCYYSQKEGIICYTAYSSYVHNEPISIIHVCQSVCMSVTISPLEPPEI